MDVNKLNKSMLRRYYPRFVPRGYILGSEFRGTYNFLKDAQYHGIERIREYQFNEIKKLINHAYNNTVYYNRLLKEYGINPKSIQDFDDIKKIPYLTKDIIRKNLNEMISSNLTKRQLQFCTTGGTTAEPLGFYIQKGVTYRKTLAFEWLNYNWGNYKLGDKVASFRGQIINNDLWVRDRFANSMIFSTYNMDKGNLDLYLKELNKFKPKYILAYPSAIEILAKHIRTTKYNCKDFVNNVDAIFTSSENLFLNQKEFIQDTFNANVFDKYGNSEQTTIIGMCEEGNYHDLSHYSYTEFLDEKGNDVMSEGSEAEIISTSFVNYAVPFIRYKTQDRVIWTNDKCKCGREMSRVKKIIGREQEFILTKNKEKIPLTTVLFAIHDDRLANVRKIQFIQKDYGILEIKIVVQGISNEEAIEVVSSVFSKKLKQGFKYNINVVEQIPLTKRGKHKFLIQEIDMNNLY